MFLYFQAVSCLKSIWRRVRLQIGRVEEIRGLAGQLRIKKTTKLLRRLPLGRLLGSLLFRQGHKRDSF